MTIEEFERLPHDQTEYCELVDGELIPVSWTNAEHNLIKAALIADLRPLVRACQLGRALSSQEYDFGGESSRC